MGLFVALIELGSVVVVTFGLVVVVWESFW